MVVRSQMMTCHSEQVVNAPVETNGVADDLGREAMASIQGFHRSDCRPQPLT